jgi:hypothetical protein
MACANNSTRRGLLLVGLAGGLAAVASAARGDETTLPAEVRAIQRELGGSAVEEYPSLRRGEVATPWWQRFSGAPDNAAPTASDSPRREAPRGWAATDESAVVPALASAPSRRELTRINALRESAAELDKTANRLEHLDLYRHADALRTLAQRLRMEARTMTGQSQPAAWPTPTRSAEGPSTWQRDAPDPDPRLAPSDSRAPTPAHAPAPTDRPTPAAVPMPASTPTPAEAPSASIVPTPQPVVDEVEKGR